MEMLRKLLLIKTMESEERPLLKDLLNLSLFSRKMALDLQLQEMPLKYLMVLLLSY
jgi:hypothetical protein